MKTPEGQRIILFKAKSERASVVPEHAIAVVGCALVARPLFDHMGSRNDMIMGGVLVGALVILVALTTTVRLGYWQPCTQAAAGCGLYFAALVFSRDDVDWTVLAAAAAITLLAIFEINAIDSAGEHARHRGWRQPAPRPGRGLRLVHSSPGIAPLSQRRLDRDDRKPAA